jgi:hypothetical protein
MKALRCILFSLFAISTPALAESWIHCAPQDGYCYVNGQAEVAYGTSGKMARKMANGRIFCSEKVFGDPAYGVAKACYVRESQHARITSNSPKWTSCAVDYNFCKFQGTRPVMYGKGNNFKWRLATNGIQCVPESFGGDPAPGIQKTCYFDANNRRQ